MFIIQLDQINMTVLFWYLVKSDANVRYFTVVNTVLDKFSKVPETHGQLVTLYIPVSGFQYCPVYLIV